jgi:ribosome-associated protein
MPRRPKAPPADVPREEPEDLTSRSDLRRANRVVEETLARLTQTLAGLGRRQLAALELPEAVFDAVTGAQAITSPPARQRQLRLVRIALRSTDWDVIAERVRHLVEHGTLPAAATGAEEALAGLEAKWVARLLGEGFMGLDAFLEEFPRADRARLKDLIHLVDRSSHDRRVKAERKLGDAIRSFLRSARPGSTASRAKS